MRFQKKQYVPKTENSVEQFRDLIRKGWSRQEAEDAAVEGLTKAEADKVIELCLRYG